MTYCESVWYEQLSVKVQLGYCFCTQHEGKDTADPQCCTMLRTNCHKPNTGVTNKTGLAMGLTPLVPTQVAETGRS